MIALLLGIISLVIAIMFTTSFDKLANEVRDIRIKYLKIDTILKFLKEKNKYKTKETNESFKIQQENEDIIAEEELESALAFENNDYYENVQFKENFNKDDIVEVFT